VDFLTSGNNLLILAIAVGAGVMLMLPGLNRARAGASVNATQAVQLINQRQAVVVDVRSADDYAAGHITHAKSAPLAELEQKATALPKNRPLLVVCGEGRHAAQAAAKLKSLGHVEVIVLDGGVRAWTQGGLPLTRKKS